MSDQCPTPRKILNDSQVRWDWGGWYAHAEDIPKFLKKLKHEGCFQDCCAYCGVKLIGTFDAWWATAVLDHAVPQSLIPCKNEAERKAMAPAWQQFEKWVWDFSNAVLACSGCNGAANRAMPPDICLPPTSINEFYELRDTFFTYRWHRVKEKRDAEREAFERLMKELS
jgi:5-methylcytosine-specific restriction endonuclease McrA